MSRAPRREYDVIAIYDRDGEPMENGTRYPTAIFYEDTSTLLMIPVRDAGHKLRLPVVEEQPRGGRCTALLGPLGTCVVVREQRHRRRAA